jgi:DUF4097 and DUF4098 domain-containing protein YvlB
VNDGVNVTDARGDVVVNAINGDILLDRVESSMVEATTVSGDVLFLGGMRDRGRYSFSTHNGDLFLGMPESANATVSVSTFNGEFESGFPVQIENTRRGKRFNFTMGSGSALVNLDSFNGTIQLQRPLVLRNIVRLRDLREVERVKESEVRKLERKRERLEQRKREER